MSPVRLRARRAANAVVSIWRMVALCFLTRLLTFRWHFREKYCEFCKMESFKRLGGTETGAR